MTVEQSCPCGSGNSYHDCCDRFHSQGAYPQTADVLMRSRYSAYVRGLVPYLEKTWHPKTRPTLTAADLGQTHWQRLEVLNHKPGLKKSTVEFKAYYLVDGVESHMHEVSTFKKVKNRWVYVDGNLSKT